MRTGRPLSRAFYRRDPVEVAPALLGKVLAVGDRRGRIVEVEAYRGPDDPASHAYRGRTARNATMWGPPGHLYVYFTYGMHWCANAVCLDDGRAGAVLLRALSPLAGLDAMRAARFGASPPPGRGRSERDLCSGPAKLCQALGLTGLHDGADLVRGPVRILDDGTPAPSPVAVSRRIGLTVGTEQPWRWLLTGDPNVSAPAR